MTVRFYSGAWRGEDGEPIGSEVMQTASSAGEYESPEDPDGDTGQVGRKSAEDPRRAKTVKRDPRKNRARQ